MSGLIELGPLQLAIATLLIVAAGVVSIALRLGIERRLAIAALRTTIQLGLLGLILERIFALDNPWLVIGLLLLMTIFAAREAVKGKRVRGASTITQQLAKNLWLSPSRSPFRKLKELILTRQLERSLSKRRILELYLNVVQFGPDVYGAEAASLRYFSIPSSQLDREQAARLAASLPRPVTWHPGVSSRGYNRSVARILARMEQADWLDRLL